MKATETPKAPKGFRIPKDTDPEAAKAADYAFQRYVDVAAGRVSPHRATQVLKGAIEIRKEVCGPIATKVDVDVKGRLEHLLTKSLDEPKDEEGGAHERPALGPTTPD
jgi:hypothetical protein